MINILVPMAGAGRRFAEAGYTIPKPFIDVAGRPMIERVLENLAVPDGRFILIAQRDHVASYPDVFTRLASRYPLTIVEIQGITEGAACTVLRAVRAINNDEPLLMANSDQFVDISLRQLIDDSEARGLNGSILTFPCDHPKWSYARTDENGIVVEVAEKRPISNHATVGIYFWQHGREFVEAVAEMISHNDRTNDEFYVCPAYNYTIAAGKKIGILEIEESQMHGLGTPEDLQIYLAQQEVVGTS